MYFLITLLLFTHVSSCAQISHNLTFTTTNDNVGVSAHIMQAHESIKYFLYNLHAYHICPLQLVITNNTEKTLLISGNSIEPLSLVAPHTIAKNVIFQHYTIEMITAYGCAITGWIGFIAGWSFMHEYVPHLGVTTKYLSATATLCSLLYQAHRFALHRSKHYKTTDAHLMRYGLSATNIIIDPGETITKVMFLNDRSYINMMMLPEDTFFYLFRLKLYNLYDSTDTVDIAIEVPKVYLPSPVPGYGVTSPSPSVPDYVAINPPAPVPEYVVINQISINS